MTTIRTLLAFAAVKDLECKQYDFVTAFLNALADKVIFVQQPYGFKEGEDLICQLLWALYGLKQSPLLWHNELSSFL